MPEKKNQHFVPESYLKPWTNQNDKITVYVPENDEKYPPTSVSNVASSDYFYSKNTQLEDSLSEIEDEYKSVLKDIREAYSTNPNLSYKNRRHLRSFILLQRVRTKAFSNDAEAMGRELANEVTEKAAVSAENIEDQLDGFRDQMKRMMLHALINTGIIGDLEWVILVDTTETHFITSTHPVIFDQPASSSSNQVVGVTNAGIQIFCPVSPTHCLFFYDSNRYHIYEDTDSPRPITNEKTTKQINECILSSNPEKVFYDAHRGSKTVDAHLSYDTTEISISPTNSDEPNSSLLLNQKAPENSPSLPFIYQQGTVDSQTPRFKDRQKIAESRQRVDTVVDYHGGDYDQALINVIQNVTTQDLTPDDPMEWNPV